MKEVKASKSGRLPIIIVIIVIIYVIGCVLPNQDESSSTVHYCDVCGSSGAKQYKSTVGGSYLSSGYYCSSCVSKRKSMGIEMTRI